MMQVTSPRGMPFPLRCSKAVKPMAGRPLSFLRIFEPPGRRGIEKEVEEKVGLGFTFSTKNPAVVPVVPKSDPKVSAKKNTA